MLSAASPAGGAEGADAAGGQHGTPYFLAESRVGRRSDRDSTLRVGSQLDFARCPSAKSKGGRSAWRAGRGRSNVGEARRAGQALGNEDHAYSLLPQPQIPGALQSEL